MVKVLDKSGQLVSAPLTPDILEEEKAEHAARAADTPGEAVKAVPTTNATTASSLAVAKAKQAALKARAQSRDSAASEEADLMDDATVLTSGSGSAVRHNPKGTTVQDLVGAKAQAKKIKATQDNSAMAVTLRAQDAAAVKSSLTKAKVVDTTERPH